jgi:hypothetical protein
MTHNKTNKYIGMQCALVAALPLLLAACGSSTEEKPHSVWDNYDVRQALPYDSQVPDSAVNQINRYDPYSAQRAIDNDAYYLPPNTPSGYIYDPDTLD